MQIKLNTSTKFNIALACIKEQYNEELIRLEGISDDQLDPLIFFKKFLGSKKIADASIDASSNVSTKNMGTMINESQKPLMKLVSYNKMFVEFMEKYDYKTAYSWLENSINGLIYNHDGHTLTTLPYCYYGKENIVVRYKGEILSINFEKLYNMVDEDWQFLDDEKIVKCKYTNDLYVKDIVANKEVWTKVIRVMHRNKKTNVNLRCLKYENGLSQIVTDEHPIITVKGDISAENVRIGDTIITKKVSGVFTNKIHEKDNILLTKELGWLFGIILSEGGVDKKEENINFKQSPTANPEIVEKILMVCDDLNIKLKQYKSEDCLIFNINNKKIINLYQEVVDGRISYEKSLSGEYVHYDEDFLYGLVGGLIDGDGNLEGYKNRRVMIRLNARTLLNQISLFLQEKGLTVRDRIPYLKNRIGSFTTTRTMYGIGATLSEKEEIVSKLDSVKVDNSYTPMVRVGNFKNKKYGKGYGETKVIENEIIESLKKEEYVYDISTESGHFLQNNILSHNCYAFSLDKIAEKGLFWLSTMPSAPAKHLTTFNSHILEFVSIASNNLSGAVGLPDLLLYMYYFYQKDIADGYISEEKAKTHLKQAWQELIFNLNQEYLRDGSQTSYTNISVFDREYFIGMFGEKKFPNGDYMVDHMEDFMQFQKDFLNCAKEIKEKNFYTFPVMTASIIFKDGKFGDDSFARFIAEYKTKFEDINVYFSDTADNLSSCCFDENQNVLVKDSKNGVYSISFKDFHEMKYIDKPNFKIFHNGNWVSGKSIKIPLGNKKMYKVTTKNKKEMIMTEDHISLTARGDIKTKDLSDNDYIAFNTVALQSTLEQDLHLTYAQGVMIGAYLGDGSMSTNGYDTILSMNKDKCDLLSPLLIKAQHDFGFNNKWSIKPSKNNVYSARLAGKEVTEEIKKWVHGTVCNTKDINLDCLQQSIEFRQGIIDGLYHTDGGNSGRIYSTSQKMIKSLEIILTSLGKQSVITKDDRTNEPCVIRGKQYNRNFALYTIKYYISNNCRAQKDLFKTVNNTKFFKIDNIELIEDYNKEYVYCFEMKNKEEQYFTLPNGVITHNCRLKNDTSLLTGNFNSIGGTSLSIGSVKVITLNLVRCALEAVYKSNAKTREEKIKVFFDNVKDATTLIHKTLDVHRHIVKKNIKKGLLPLYTYGLMDLKTQYSTIGINGIYEAVQLLGGISSDESGSFYTEEGKVLAVDIMQTIDNMNKEFSSEKDYTINMEQVPFESGSVKNCKKDKLLFGEVLKKDIYGNQWVPLDEDCSLFHRLEMSALLDSKASGGAILHVNRSKEITAEQSYQDMKAYASMGIVYYATIIVSNICEHNHTYTEKTNTCPICGGKKVDESIKIVGYCTRKSAYQKEREEEMERRIFYK